MILRVVHRFDQSQEHVSHISLMANISVDYLVHTLHVSVEINIELIPFALSVVLRYHHDIIHHRKHNHYI
jgi:hypothetical protein